MQKKKTAVPTYLGVAAVWIGSHFGPGFATGAFSVRWYVKYGWVGLVTPLLAMLITGGVMYFMLEYAREHGTPNYRPFARSCYGEKLGGVVAVLYDICFLMTMMCAGGLAFSGEGKLLQGFLGVNYWATAIVTILISAALCLYGSKLLAKSSGYMMYAIVGVVLLITVLALTCGDSDVPGAFANSAANAKDPSLLDAILSAMQYGCFQSTIVFNVMSVSDVVKDKKEARKAIGAGYLITILLMVCLIFTLFSYTNVFDVCAETLPVMSVLNRLGMKWLQWLYVILMTLAVLTSAAGLAHAGNVRFDGLFRFIKNAQLRRFVITAILLGIAAVGAALGFQAMLQQGTSIVGWAAIPIVVSGEVIGPAALELFAAYGVETVSVVKPEKFEKIRADLQDSAALKRIKDRTENITPILCGNLRCSNENSSCIRYMVPNGQRCGALGGAAVPPAAGTGP